jgi:hypothetical protein
MQQTSELQVSQGPNTWNCRTGRTHGHRRRPTQLRRLRVHLNRRIGNGQRTVNRLEFGAGLATVVPVQAAFDRVLAVLRGAASVGPRLR